MRALRDQECNERILMYDNIYGLEQSIYCMLLQTIWAEDSILMDDEREELHGANHLSHMHWQESVFFPAWRPLAVHH